MQTVYQTTRQRILQGVGLALLLHIVLAVVLQLLAIQRPITPEYAGIVFIELADFDPVEPAETVAETAPEQPAEPAPAEPAPQPPDEPAQPAEPAPPAPSQPPPPAREARPSPPEEQLEFRFQQEIPDAALRTAPDTTAPPEPVQPSAVGPPEGPTDAEIALRRENLLELQEWLDSQPDLAPRPAPQADAEPTVQEGLSDQRLQEIDRILSRLTGPDQQVRAIDISQTADPQTDGQASGDLPRLAGNRVRIGGSDPMLSNTLLRSADPPVLTAMVSFVVDPQGRVVDLQFEKSSGNNEIDARIRSAVQGWQFTPAPGSRNARGEITYTIRRVQ
ncbi:energy transducer TonB [Spirochaeta africana]|uniref:TonB family protein n=1 Tax=Spirochaeta africana (strain ATCC 700263 / DSM 8902 / Z-7692) TaxID=889378 RepID=H9UKH2_SPIAZ|nr:energy transducer TonB [Spirochaeta africana]AFG38015.1 TonB family protein [Spirochaeta africana DSM 8902]